MSLHILPTRAISTSVALVGASVIAVSTIAPTPLQNAQIPIASPAVQLAAAPSPLEFYPQVAGRTLTNAGLLAWDYLTVGPGLVLAVVTDPAAAFQQSVALIGQVIVTVPFIVLGFPSIFAGPVMNGAEATLVAINDINNAVAASDAADLANAVIDLPARIIDGVLNGGYFDPGYGEGYDPGLLTPLGGRYGPLALPLSLLKTIFDASGVEFPFRPALGAAGPGLRAAPVALRTGPSVDSGSQPTDPGFAEAESNAPTQRREVRVAVAKSGDDIAALTSPPVEPAGQATVLPTPESRKLDATSTEPSVDKTRSLRTDLVARKTQLREAVKEAGSKLSKAVNDISSSVKKSLTKRHTASGTETSDRRPSGAAA